MYLKPKTQQIECFSKLVQYVDINVLKAEKDFLILTETLKPNLNAENFFKIALQAVQKDNLQKIQFLIENCDLKALAKITGGGGITLLHEATLCSSKNLVEFLLRHGADVNAIDSEGRGVLHRIAQVPNREFLIKTFKSHRVNFEVMDEDGQAPLCLTRIVGNSKTIAQLEPHSSRMKNKKADEDRIHILKKGLKLNITHDSKEVMLAGIYRELMSTGCNPKYYEQSHRLLLSVFQPPFEKSLLWLMIDTYVLGITSEPEKIIVYLQENLVKNKFSLDHILVMGERVHHIFLNTNEVDSAIRMGRLIYSMMKDIKQESLNTSIFLNSLCVFFNKFNLFTDAALAGNLGLSFLPKKDTHGETEALLNYNIGLAQFNCLSHQEALEKFYIAHKLLPNEADIFLELVRCLMLFGKFDEVITLCSNSSLGEYSDLVTIHAKYYLKKLNPKQVLSLITKEYATRDSLMYALDVQSNIYIKLRNYEAALDAGKKSFALSSKDLDVVNCYQITKMLNIYIECERYQEGLKFLQSQMNKYSAIFETHPLLASYTVAMYSANHMFKEANQLMDKLQNLKINMSTLSQLFIILAIDCVNHNNLDYENTLYFLNAALHLDPECIKICMYIRLIEMLNHNLNKYHNKSLEFDIDFSLTQFAIANNLFKDVLLGTEDIYAEYDPAKIHLYFQEIKKKELSDLINTGPQDIEASQWLINEILYNTEKKDICILSDKFLPNHFAMIKPNLNLDNDTLRRFQIALEKGLCTNKTHKNGVKFLKNSVIELKIDDDRRLFTSCVYRNPQGKSLIIFDRIGNHKEIKRMAKTKSVVIIDVPSTATEQLSQNQASFFNNNNNINSDKPTQIVSSFNSNFGNTR